MLSFARRLALIVLSTLCSFAQSAEPVGERLTYKKVKGTELALYVAKPKDWATTDSRPAIVFLHGGGWVGGQPGQFTEHAKHLAEKGMVAFQVQYRLLEKDTDTPPDVCIADAVDAMRWIRSRAGEFGVDPDRIASAGGSAGGHLAAYVGMIADGEGKKKKRKYVSAKSNAMVLFNPVLDNGPEGWGHERVGPRYAELSPFHNVSSDDPPMLVMSGEKDALIPPETFFELKRKMEEVGVRCDVKITKGAGHGFFNHGKEGNLFYQKTVGEMDAFLTDLGWLGSDG